MSKKPKNIEKFTVVASDKREIKNIPVDVLKSIYVTSESSIDSLARKYGLSRNIIENHIREGNWEELRRQNREKSLNQINADVEDLLEDLIEIQKQSLRLKTLELKEKIEDTTRYLVEKGSLKATDLTTGNEILDSFGQAMYLKIPGNAKDLMEVQQGVTILAGLMKALRELVNEDKIKKLEAPDEELTADKLLNYKEDSEG